MPSSSLKVVKVSVRVHSKKVKGKRMPRRLIYPPIPRKESVQRRLNKELEEQINRQIEEFKEN